MAQAKYITQSELRESFDIRMISQLATFTGGTPDASTSNAAVANAIEKASAEIQSYALRGNRYTAGNLDTIHDADDWTLKGLCSTLTMKHLFRGKAAAAPPDVVAMIGEATATLESLGDGKRIFNFDTAASSGKASISIISNQTRGYIGMVSDSAFFPTRQDRKY
tara:strand:+ start:247 stop:741 length:495 start_codon:yes stop_codon:yes gene_type:complete